MKTNLLRSLVNTLALTGGLLLVDSSRAAVTSVINSPVGSYATIQFIDTTSLNPSFNPGTTSLNQNITPWGGAAPINNTLSTTTDPVTFDFAQGDIVANVIGGNYSIALNNVVLNQIAGNTGFADLIFSFSVEFQLDGAGLLSQATVFPNFSVNGTVQSSIGSFASVNGNINYYGTDYYGVYGLLDTVNYNALFNTPGNFSSIISGVSINVTTPNLAPNTVLDLVGYLDFKVDPASINAETVPVPEPGSGLLLGFAAVSGLLWRRYARPAALS
jgi:hypothetical protein